MVRTQPVDYIVCAAGNGVRLKEAIPHLPKPLAKLNGQTLLERSLSSLDLQYGDRLIVVCQKSHRIRASLGKRLAKKYENVEIKWVELQQVTRGQLETALQAKEQLRGGHPVAIFNADTYFKLNEDWWKDDVDGLIPCAHADGDAWSFCQVDTDGWVERVTEKERISDRASVGFYYFRNFKLLAEAANEELNAIPPDREIFVAPIYNRLIAKGAKISSPMVQTFQPMGTLDQIKTFWQIEARELEKENQPSQILNFAAAFAGLMVSLLIFSPGITDNDTGWQLWQARAQTYNNWHPPLLAYVWHWLLFIFPTTWGPFLLSNVMFWSGLALTVGALLKKWPAWAPWVTLGIGLCPWMFTYNACLWKDAAFGSAMILATGLLLQSEGLRRSKLLFAGIFLTLFFATGVRHNGIAGALPLFLFLAQSFRRPILMAIVMGVLAYALNGVVSSLIAEDYAPSQVFLVYDLAGTSLRAEKNLFPPDLYKIQMEQIRANYRTFSVEPIIWATIPEDKKPHAGVVSPADLPKVTAAWAKAILHYPSDYLLHRLSFTTQLLQIQTGEEAGRIHLTKDLLPQEASLFRSDSLTQKFFLKMIKLQNESIFFRGYFFLGALILLGIYFVYFGTLGENAMVFSALLYFGSFVVTGVAADLRYIWWLMIVTTVLFVRFAFTELERVRQHFKSTK